MTFLSFDQFMILILEKLVKYALSNRVYPWAPTQPSTITAKQIALYKKDSRWQQSSETIKNTSPNGYELDYYSDFFQGNNRLINESNFLGLEELEFIYYICAVDMAPHRLKSDYEEDKKSGIRHLYFHNQNGFVQNIKFSKINDKYIESSIISKQNSTAVMKLMSGVYKASVKMIGNCFFRVGEYVYINPTIGAVGLSKTLPIKTSEEEPPQSYTPIELAKEIGLGGYYMVTKIDSKIGIGEYTTNVELRYHSKGIKKKTEEDNIISYGVAISQEIEDIKKGN
jgi:hypothetical protein